MKKLFSGIQPTGTVHLGNYIGAIKNWVDLQESYDCIYSVVDLHSLTIKYDVSEMTPRILDMAKTLIACGLDPDKCTIMVQGSVKEHAELMWYFSAVTPMGELNRMTQFKDKSSQNPGNINLGLYAYPVLQAADILLYKGEVVPVGEDQVQHIEFTREIARNFNNRYDTDFFPEPVALLTKTPRLIGTDGETKMSKSKDNYIGLEEDDESIRKKVMASKTDPARLRRSDPGNPDVCNIYTWHTIFSSPEEQNECAAGCRSAEIGCVDCKKIVLKNMMKVIAPIREKKQELDKNDDYICEVLAESTKKCREEAKRNIEEIRKAMGLVY
jgi:tryptophanyl-tRNA synthetase